MGSVVQAIKPITLAVMIGAGAALSMPADSQSGAAAPPEKPGEATSDVTSLAGCTRPDDAQDAKVVDLDSGKSVAKLAVNLGSGRFKLVRITAWDRPEDPRPLIPVIEAARITQGILQFYTPNPNTDPESAHEAFLIMADMGGGTVCWATPSSLMKAAAYPVSEGDPPKGHSGPEPIAPPIGRPENTPAPAPPGPRSQAEVKPENTPPPDRPAQRSRTRTRGQATPRQ